MSKTSLVTDFVPPIAFTFVYVVTCLVGAVLLLFRSQAFISAFEYFSGTPAPQLTPDQGRIAVVLLAGPPALLWLGYLASFRLVPWRSSETASSETVSGESRAAIAVCAVLIIAGLISLFRSGSLANLSAWFSYSDWIEARWAAFRGMSFAEFVNIYTLLPIAAAWLVLMPPRTHLLRWLPTVAAVGLTLAIYQKKAALVVILIVLSAWALDRARIDPARVRRVIATCLFATVGLYGAMVLLPTIEPFLAVAGEEQNGKHASPGDRIVSWLSYEASLERGVLPQIVIGMLGRTSGPALTYPVIFPAVHEFYGPDFALDVVCSRRLGCSGRTMPDDNLIVWNQMYPHNPGGSITAPFQFALYSQGGLPWSLVGAVLLGVGLGILWRAVRTRVLGTPWVELLGAVTILAAVNLALDSPRNALLVSYGALWGLAFVIVLAIVVPRFESGRGRRILTMPWSSVSESHPTRLSP